MPSSSATCAPAFLAPARAPSAFRNASSDGTITSPRAQRLELTDEPRDVFLLGGPEATGLRAPEAGELRGHDVGAAQLRAQPVPDRRCLGNSMDEYRRHLAPLVRSAGYVALEDELVAEGNAELPDRRDRRLQPPLGV